MSHWICKLVGHNFVTRYSEYSKEAFDYKFGKGIIICPRCGETRKQDGVESD